jgi:hypothetical protein
MTTTALSPTAFSLLSFGKTGGCSAQTVCLAAHLSTGWPKAFAQQKTRMKMGGKGFFMEQILDGEHLVYQKTKGI